MAEKLIEITFDSEEAAQKARDDMEREWLAHRQSKIEVLDADFWFREIY